MLLQSLDVKKAKVVQQWKHDRPLVSCRIDPSGKYVFTGSEDAVVSRFRLSDGAKTALAGGHDTWVRCFGFAGPYVVSGGSDGRLTWWEKDGDSPSAVRTVEAHAGWIRSVDVDAAGQVLASGANDNLIRLWNAQTGEPIRDLEGHERHVYSVAFHPSEPILVSGDLKGVVRQWDVASGAATRDFEAKDLHSFNGGQKVDFGGVRTLAINADGKRLAAGGLHKATNPLGAVHEPLVLLFDWKTGKLEKKLTAPKIKRGVIWRLVWLGDGTLMGVCGGGDGGFLLFWNPDAEKDSDKDFHRFKLPNIARDMDLHSDGVQVATAHHDRQVRLTKLTG